MNATNFTNLFNTAEKNGVEAIKDTYNRVFIEEQDDFYGLTDFVVFLRDEVWKHVEVGDRTISKLYDALWGDAYRYACDNLQDSELTYFLNAAA